MKHPWRFFAAAFFLVQWVAWSLPCADAGMYRYTDEQGVPHFTDDIRKVPENQRPSVIPEEQEPKAVLPEEETPGRKDLPAPPVSGVPSSASTGADGVSVFAEKEALDAEFSEIIKERDRLQRERSIPGGPAEVKAYNDAVFALKDRIAAYQKRCDDYAANVKAFKEKMDAFEKKMPDPAKAARNPSPKPPSP